MQVSDLTISELGPKGDGIAQGAQGRIYVDRALPGDRIQGRVLRGVDGMQRAEITKMISPSPYRQKPPCVHYDNCGSCTIQHLKDEFYRQWKTDLVKDAFRKQRLSPRQWLPTQFIGKENRRRATFTAQKRRGQLTVGYYRRRSQQIFDLNSCLIADPKLLGLREAMKPFLNVIVGEGNSLDVFFQLVGGAIDMVLTGPVSVKGLPDNPVREAASQFLNSAKIARISWRASEDDAIRQLASQGKVIAEFGLLKVNLPPAAFLQPTLEGESALTQAVMAALPARGHFADLFAGCGTFSGPMLARGTVEAYESVSSSVSALTKAAENERKPLKAFRRDLFRNPLRRDELNRFTAVVFDPPRAGCPEQAQQMAASRVPTLIGVSCNPLTFARDAAVLVQGGYRLQSLQPIDQFLWSHHVEVVGVFTKPLRR